MRTLMLHASKFKAEIVAKSSRPKGIVPLEHARDSEAMSDCLVVLFCVEKGDSEKQLDELYREIIKTAEEIRVTNLMIGPFAHLSKGIAGPSLAKRLFEKLMEKLKGTKFAVNSSPFGYHKTLLLDVKGHPGAFRYREFY